MSLTHNISLLIAEASDLFSLINNLELDSENKNKIMQAAICDLSCIGKAISSADKNLSNEERLVLAIFLRFPFLERTDIDYIQSWKLLDEKEKIQVLKSVDQALEIALDTIPDRISTLDYILESGADQKNSGTAQRFSTHIFRFAQILALSHHGTKAEEKNELKKLAEILARQLNSYKYNDKKSKNPAKEKSAAIDINSISKNEEFDVETEILSLDQLIGLHSVKAEVRSLINLIRLQQARKNEGLKSVDVSLHAVFTGPPGTGKTTVARIYARILKALGICLKVIW